MAAPTTASPAMSEPEPPEPEPPEPEPPEPEPPEPEPLEPATHERIDTPQFSIGVRKPSIEARVPKPTDQGGP
jgi:hypothetical protein